MTRGSDHAHFVVGSFIRRALSTPCDDVSLSVCSCGRQMLHGKSAGDDRRLLLPYVAYGITGITVSVQFKRFCRSAGFVQ